MIIFLLPPILLAGPPFLTDDPEPVDYMHWEFYLASQDIFTSKESTGTMPHFEVNYGVIENIQIHLVVPLGYSHLINNRTNYGISDIEFGIKYRFIQESENIPQIGIFPFSEIPAGNKSQNLGNGQFQFYLPVWLQKSFGNWQTYGGAGYWFNSAPGSKNWLYTGWLLQNEISEVFTMGGEIYYQTKQSDKSRNTLGFNIGGYINLNEINHLLFSIGRSLSGDNFVTAYLGYQWTI